MFDSTETVTYNSVGKALVRQTSTGPYKIKYGFDDAVTETFHLRLEHNVPTSPALGGATHMARLDIERFDAEGVYLRTDSAWLVLKTTGAVQNSAEMDLTAQALIDYLSDRTWTN